jgi:uncharacterized protein CbrC (UPF0167 family)
VSSDGIYVKPGISANLSVEKIGLEIGEHGRDFIKYYERGGDPAIYKFVCRHCGEVKLYTDFT